jgi:hypothetical protein
MPTVKTSVCGNSGASVRKTQVLLAPKVLGLLNGNGKGRFRTRGRYSSATVRGTIWLTAERCDGTFTSVRVGALSVFDQAKKKTIILTARHSYLAKPPAKKP